MALTAARTSTSRARVTRRVRATAATATLTFRARKPLPPKVAPRTELPPPSDRLNFSVVHSHDERLAVAPFSRISVPFTRTRAHAFRENHGGARRLHTQLSAWFELSPPTRILSPLAINRKTKADGSVKTPSCSRIQVTGRTTFASRRGS